MISWTNCKKVALLVAVAAALVLLRPLAAAAQGPDVAQIPLVPGWNLVSLPLAPDVPSLPAALASIDGSYGRGQAYGAAQPDAPWVRFKPDGPPYASTLTALDERMGLDTGTKIGQEFDPWFGSGDGPSGPMAGSVGGGYGGGSWGPPSGGK